MISSKPERPAPIPCRARAVKTDTLIRQRSTDVERWARTDSLASQWDGRAALAARLISDNTSVLDVGCGAMALQTFLPSGCKYFPADVVSRMPGAYVVDLNKGEFPEGKFDYIVMLGVVEYIHDARKLLETARHHGKSLIVTYCGNISLDLHVRRAMGWVNDLSGGEFRLLLESAGWVIEYSAVIKRGGNNVQEIYSCTGAM